MDLTTNGVVVITDAIKSVQTNKEKLTIMSAKDEDDKESKEPDYDEDDDQLEEEQEKETGEVTEETTTTTKSLLNTYDKSRFFTIIVNAA
jgi:hypothetical protein